jgi:hypothetical protein
MDRVNTAPCTTAEATESLGHLSVAERAGLMGTLLDGYTNHEAHVTCTMTELDITPLDATATVDIHGIIHTPAFNSPGAPRLLSPGLTSMRTSIPVLAFAKHAAAMQVALAAATDDTGCVPPPELICLDSSPPVQQDKSEIHHDVLTIFDPGGYLFPTPWRAVCRPQPH